MIVIEGLSIGAVLIIFTVWLIFLGGLIYFIAMLCRQLAFWHETDRVKTYVTVRSPRIASLLIPKYVYIRQVSVARSGYYINAYPNRLPLLALIDYCGAAILFSLYAVGITKYFFFSFFGNSLIPISVMLLMGYLIVFFFLLRWDHSRSLNEAALITRAEMKRLKRESRQLRRD